ncbi:MAG: ATP-binding protein [Thermodesulfobacteriota bacterium]
MSPRPSSLRFRLAAGLAVLAVIGVGLQFAVFGRVAESMRQDVAARNLDLAHAIAGEVDNAVGLPAHALSSLVSLLDEGLSGKNLDETLQDILRFIKVVELVQILDQEGRVLSVAPANPDQLGLDFSNQPFFRDARNAPGAVYSDSFISMQTSAATATISQAYSRGVAALQLRVDEISRMAGVLPPQGGGFIAVVDARGVVIGHTDPQAALRRESLKHLEVLDSGDGKDVSAMGAVNGLEGILSVSPVRGAGWKVVVFEPSSHAFASIANLYSYTLGGVAVVALCSVLAMFAFQAQLLRPLGDLTAQTREVAGGRYDVAITPAFREFVPLAESFTYMTEQLKNREEALLVSRRRIASAVDAMPSFVAFTDGEGRIEHWNAEAARLTGVSAGEAKGQLLEDAAPQLAPVLAAVEQCNSIGLPVKWEKLNADFGAGKRTFDVLAYPLASSDSGGVVLRIDDITDRIRMEEIMVHTEKMMTVGGLAAGMAHEINNPLGGILMSAQNLGRRLDTGLAANIEAAREAGVDLAAMRSYLEKRGIFAQVESIRELGARAGKIVSNMLGFSRRSHSGYIPVKPEELIERSLELAVNDYELKKRLDLKTVTVHRRYDPEVPATPVNRNQIEQVLLNIFKNAAQAMTATAGQRPPELWIETSREKDEAVIVISDNGPGMPEEVRERVFEPFFTTKEVGQGTGLGLSVSYYIVVTMHKGSIRVDSAPGQGASFTIRLPIFRQGIASGPPAGQDES